MPDVPPEPSSSQIDAKTLNLIRAANLANIVKKVKAGKPLSKAELELLESAPAKEPETWHPNQKSNGKKSTAAEVEERVEFVAQLIVNNNAQTHEIRREVQARWGVHWRTCDEYTVRAKSYLQKRVQITAEEAKGIGMAHVMDVMATGKGSERIASVRLYFEIFGCFPATTIRDSRTPGEVVTVSNPSPMLPQVHLYLPEGRSSMFKPPGAEPKEAAPDITPQPTA